MSIGAIVKDGGRRLVERLGWKIVRTEGNDLRGACVHGCGSADNGHIDRDTGVYGCWSCGKGLSALDFCKVVLRCDFETAKRTMIDVGLWEDRSVNGGASTAPAVKSNAATGFVRPAGWSPARPSRAVDDGGKASSDNETIDLVAQRKGTTGDGFRAYGAFVRNGLVIFPTFRLNEGRAERISCFYIDPKSPDDKGRNKTGKDAGQFLPCILPETTGGNAKVCRPRAGSQWLICEGGKNGAAYSQLGFFAVGLNGKHVKKEFLPGFVAAFKGVDVVLVPDGDYQSIGAFKKLAAALYTTAKAVRIASLPYDGVWDTGGDDVRDVLKKFGGEGPQAVRDAIAAAPVVGKDGEPTRPIRFLDSLVTSRQLADEAAEVSYLVDGILTAGEPGTVGGPAKCLKTLTMVDLVLSVASGQPFLNRFKVLRQGPVGFLSGESGRAVLRRAVLRIAKAKGIDEANGIDFRELPIAWGFSLPQLTVREHIAALGDWIVKEKLVLVGLDPAYLCLLNAANAGKAGNLFAMGAALAPLSEIVGQTGATVVLLHHYRKNRPDNGGEPADLEDLAMSGMMEWSRFWLLLDRVEPYANDGLHKLWLRAGGSAGHAGLYGLTVNERAGEAGDGWQVGVELSNDARKTIQQAKENRRAAELERREGKHVEKVLEALRQFPEGETVRAIRTPARLNNQDTERALYTLQKDGRVEACEIQKGGRKYAGFRLIVR